MLDVCDRGGGQEGKLRRIMVDDDGCWRGGGDREGWSKRGVII